MSGLCAPPRPSLRHLSTLSDARNGLTEHAMGSRPRPELGYCTDDAGRLLAVASRLAGQVDARALAVASLGFLAGAQRHDGSFFLRRDRHGRWTDDPPSDDAAGRALFGLGVAVATAPWRDVRSRALALFRRAAGFRTDHPRAAAYAAIGAVELLRVHPGATAAVGLVEAALGLVDAQDTDRTWRWPAERLTYANALLPDAQLAAGALLDDVGAVDRALETLEWLVALETDGDHFSFTPVQGRGRDDPRPSFDQQPIEAWAMVDACARAHEVTLDRRWHDRMTLAAAWFAGRNDTGALVYDPITGGGFDGLTACGVNLNQGAESTLAFVGSMTTWHRLRRPADGADALSGALR